MGTTGRAVRFEVLSADGEVIVVDKDAWVDGGTRGDEGFLFPDKSALVPEILGLDASKIPNAWSSRRLKW